MQDKRDKKDRRDDSPPPVEENPIEKKARLAAEKAQHALNVKWANSVLAKCAPTAANMDAMVAHPAFDRVPAALSTDFMAQLEWIQSIVRAARAIIGGNGGSPPGQTVIAVSEQLKKAKTVSNSVFRALAKAM